MGTTTATLYLRPSFSAGGGGGAVILIPLRFVTGLFSAVTAVSASTSRNKDWKPDRDSAWVDPKTGKPTVQLVKFVDYVAEKVLGGSNNKTLPQVESLITYAQAQSLFTTLIGAALAQQVSAIAQSADATRQVLVAAGTAGAAQIPPVPLAPADVNQPTLPESPGGDGGGGDGG